MQDQGSLERQHWLESRQRLEAAVGDPVLRRQAHRLLWEICQVLHDRDAALAHLQAAIATDTSCVVLSLPRIGLDVDNADDLRSLAAYPGYKHAQKLARRLGFGEAAEMLESTTAVER